MKSAITDLLNRDALISSTRLLVAIPATGMFIFLGYVIYGLSIRFWSLVLGYIAFALVPTAVLLVFRGHHVWAQILFIVLQYAYVYLVLTIVHLVRTGRQLLRE